MAGRLGGLSLIAATALYCAAGRAPDLGAYEVGAPPVHYGPRTPAGTR